MGGEPPVHLQPWMLPLAALAIVTPIAVATILAGPQVGFAVGAIVAATVIVLAARLRPQGKLEIAPASDDRHRLLVLATGVLDDPRIAGRIARDLARHGDGVQESDVRVLAPALNTRLAHWVSDLRQARLEAQQRLAVSLATLATAEVPATGHVGDTDPMQATEDELRGFSADEVVLVSAGSEPEHQLSQRLQLRLDVPLRHLVAGEPPPRG